MLQAIQTKYLGPTNSRGSRVKTYCRAGGVTVEWLSNLDAEENHKRAVMQLIKKLEWDGITWACGWSTDDRGVTAVAIGRKDEIRVLDGFGCILINCL